MPFLCVVGGQASERERAARDAAAGRGRLRPVELPAWRWPLVRDPWPASAPDEPSVMLVPDLHDAFPAGQISGTRLVLTQSTYQLQRWLDWLAARPHVSIVAHADRAALRTVSPEAFARRGPWSAVEMIELDGDEPREETARPGDPLYAAFLHGDPAVRRDACMEALRAEADNPALHVALSSVYMELDTLQDAQDALERALAIAPDWEAVLFEYGKLWLRADDLERAAERFAEAARLMPTFSAALSNLGAALGETERPEEAVDALTRALQHDPNGYPILNNLSVLYREQGHLDDAVESARRVVALAPSFVFGYYNLAHALFLQGRFEDAREAYEVGHRRDPQKNPVQACRLAVARAAAGAGDTAVSLLEEAAAALTPDMRDEVLAETEEILEALLQLPGGPRADVRRLLEATQAQRETGS